jgi:hypothetical protein
MKLNKLALRFNKRTKNWYWKLLFPENKESGAVGGEGYRRRKDIETAIRRVFQCDGDVLRQLDEQLATLDSK